MTKEYKITWCMIANFGNDSKYSVDIVEREFVGAFTGGITSLDNAIIVKVEKVIEWEEKKTVIRKHLTKMEYHNIS